MENNCDDAAQGRDKEKFVQTVREHKGTIYTVCYMFSKDTDEVNDLYQEILMNLWRGFGSFEGKSDIRTWIYRVALNTCISIDRKKKRKPVRLNMDIDLYEDTDTDTRQVRMLYNRISRLGPFDRAIILLWLDNIPYEEIGEIVGISAKYVSVRLLRIKEELRKMNRIVDREFPDAHRENLIVLDGTTGQNALEQARQFGEAASLTGIILTKLDGTAKGGIAVAIQSELNVPVKYIGVGEHIDDLQKFDADAFVNALFLLES